VTLTPNMVCSISGTANLILIYYFTVGDSSHYPWRAEGLLLKLSRVFFSQQSPPDRGILRGSATDRRGAIFLIFPSTGFSYRTQSKNFLALCASNYYDGCIFHRNIKGFMIQTGDPSGTGKGGESIWGKPFPDEIRSTLKVRTRTLIIFLSLNTLRLKFNARGVVAMANTGPDTNKSQFFITYAKQPHLDSKYTIFGKVIDGADLTLDAMERVPVNNKNRPLAEIKLTHVSQPHFDRPVIQNFNRRLLFTRTPSRMQCWCRDDE